jgi:hypothetical protein
VHEVAGRIPEQVEIGLAPRRQHPDNRQSQRRAKQGSYPPAAKESSGGGFLFYKRGTV